MSGERWWDISDFFSVCRNIRTLLGASEYFPLLSHFRHFVRNPPFFDLLSVDHLVASLQPADSRHLPARSCSVQVNNHVIFGHQQLQAAHHVPEKRNKRSEHLHVGTIMCKNHRKKPTETDSPWCRCSRHSCCRGGNRPRTRWWRSNPHHNNLRGRILTLMNFSLLVCLLCFYDVVSIHFCFECCCSSISSIHPSRLL